MWRLVQEDGLLKRSECAAAPTQEPRERERGESQGTIGWLGRGVCRVWRGGEEIHCDLPPELALGQQTDLAVGDEVIYAERGGRSIVRTVLPRRTWLSRQHPGVRARERVVAANVDAVVVVASVRTPRLRVRLLDRYLVAIRRGGAQPVIVVNKIDLLAEAERSAVLEVFDPYRAIEVPVLPCAASTGRGVGELRAALAGRLCVFVGQSGVGKTSLLNALEPGTGAATAEVGQVGKGRHTTTASSLYHLANGTRVLDTPGIREFGLYDVGAEEIEEAFPEFTGEALACRFTDCTHLHEPGCGVRAAVAEGRIAAERYDSYRGLRSGSS